MRGGEALENASLVLSLYGSRGASGAILLGGSDESASLEAAGGSPLFVPGTIEYFKVRIYYLWSGLIHYFNLSKIYSLLLVNRSGLSCLWALSSRRVSSSGHSDPRRPSPTLPRTGSSKKYARRLLLRFLCSHFGDALLIFNSRSRMLVAAHSCSSSAANAGHATVCVRAAICRVASTAPRRRTSGPSRRMRLAQRTFRPLLASTPSAACPPQPRVRRAHCKTASPPTQSSRPLPLDRFCRSSRTACSWSQRSRRAPRPLCWCSCGACWVTAGAAHSGAASSYHTPCKSTRWRACGSGVSSAQLWASRGSWALRLNGRCGGRRSGLCCTMASRTPPTISSATGATLRHSYS